MGTRVAIGLLAGALLLAPARTSVARTSVARTSVARTVVEPVPSIRPGPYSALTVDPVDPRRLAVGTANGYVLFSEDGARTSHEQLVIPPRRYDVMVMRGQTRWAAYSQPIEAGRAIRLQIALGTLGLPTMRWAFWKVLLDPITEISDVALPSGAGAMAAASPFGVLVTDPMRGAWSRRVGGPGPMHQTVWGRSAGIDPNEPRHIFAGTATGLYVSRDGGHNFALHSDSALAQEDVQRIAFDQSQPGVVLVVGAGTVYQSEDGGVTFTAAFSVDGVIHAVALAPDGVWVSTSDGLYVTGGETPRRLFAGETVVGAIPQGNGRAIIATDLAILQLEDDDSTTPLFRTTPDDPLLRLGGNAELGWAITRRTLFRVGAREPRARRQRAPEMLLSALEVEHAVAVRAGITDPESTRLHDRWWAKMLPRLSVEASGWLQGGDHLRFDGIFPIGFRHSDASAEDEAQLLVWAHWDFSKFIFGDQNVTNHVLFLESNLRTMQKTLLEEARWRYRECASLAARLARPPADPVVALSWRMRLEEYSAYLSAVTGRDVVDLPPLE